MGLWSKRGRVRRWAHRQARERTRAKAWAWDILRFRSVGTARKRRVASGEGGRTGLWWWWRGEAMTDHDLPIGRHERSRDAYQNQAFGRGRHGNRRRDAGKRAGMLGSLSVVLRALLMMLDRTLMTHAGHGMLHRRRRGGGRRAGARTGYDPESLCAGDRHPPGRDRGAHQHGASEQQQQPMAMCRGQDADGTHAAYGLRRARWYDKWAFGPRVRQGRRPAPSPEDRGLGRAGPLRPPQAGCSTPASPPAALPERRTDERRCPTTTRVSPFPPGGNGQHIPSGNFRSFCVR